MWVPLQNLEAVWKMNNNQTPATDQGPYIALQTEATVASAPIKFDLTNDWFMHQRTSVYLAGCTSICVSVKDADSMVANAMIVGRFVG